MMENLEDMRRDTAVRNRAVLGAGLDQIGELLDQIRERGLGVKLGKIIREAAVGSRRTRDDLSQAEIAKLQSRIAPPPPPDVDPMAGARMVALTDVSTAKPGRQAEPRPAVQILDANGKRMPGVRVTFVVNKGQGATFVAYEYPGGGRHEVATRDVVTDADGIAAVEWRLGAAGPHRLTVIAGNLSTTLSGRAGDPEDE